MNRSELIRDICRRAGLPEPTARKVLDALFGQGEEQGAIAAALQQSQTVHLHGFGTFVTRRRPPRQGRNPRTGEKLSIPARTLPFFRPAGALCARLEST